MIIKSNVELKGFKGSEKCKALVDTGAAMTVIDKSLAKYWTLCTRIGRVFLRVPLDIGLRMRWL
ncbi:MAG: hypothetical protein QXL27_00350 [Candidatus Bathyarchaeia archaeon]